MKVVVTAHKRACWWTTAVKGAIKLKKASCEVVWTTGLLKQQTGIRKTEGLQLLWFCEPQIQEE